MKVYFDNAATTPIDPEVIQSMVEMMENYYGNPSSIHAPGRKVRAALEEARKTVANAIGASLGEIFFTSGGTEANNMALKCSVRDLGVQRIISSPIEHHCVGHVLEKLEKENGVEVILLNVDSQGDVDLDQLQTLLDDTSKKTLVSLMHANNEIGNILDLDRVSKMCEAANAYLHSDTVQTIGLLPIDVNKTKISFLSAGAHKFYGPKGIGFIYINSDNIIKPYIDGGAQERNMRGGTENVYGIVGLAKALELALANREARYEQMLKVKNHFMKRLKDELVDIHFNGNQANNSPKVLSVCFPDSPKSELLIMNLDIFGIAASGGSACSSGIESASHVIKALNNDPNRMTVRFSFSYKSTTEEVDYVIEKLKMIVEAKEMVA